MSAERRFSINSAIIQSGLRAQALQLTPLPAVCEDCSVQHLCGSLLSFCLHAHSAEQPQR